LDRARRWHSIEWQEVTPARLLAVDGEGVYLVACVSAPEKPVRCSPVPVAPDEDYVLVTCAPLALDTDELRSEIEDQVVAFVSVGSIDTDTELDRGQGDRQFGDGSLLIGREHTNSVRARPDELLSKQTPLL